VRRHLKEGKKNVLPNMLFESTATKSLGLVSSGSRGGGEGGRGGGRGERGGEKGGGGKRENHNQEGRVQSGEGREKQRYAGENGGDNIFSKKKALKEREKNGQKKPNRLTREYRSESNLLGEIGRSSLE